MKELKELKIIVHDLNEILRRPEVAERMKQIEAEMDAEEEMAFEMAWEADREFRDKHRD